MSKAIFILVPLLALAGWSLSGPVIFCSTFGNAYASVQGLSISCQVFQSDYGVIPPEETWWEEITATPSAVVNTKGKVYTNHIENMDPWGSPFVYKPFTVGRAEIPGVYSLGQDRESATDGNDPDDIASWRDAKEVWAYYRPPFFSPKRILIGSIVAAAYLSLLAYLHSKRIRPASEPS
jgi:hypothetical protein